MARMIRPEPELLLSLRRLLLAPLLLAQARSVRRNMMRLPEPSGPREGVVGAGPALRLLVLGDSAAAGVGVEQQDQALCGRLLQGLSEGHAVHWKLLARTGLKTSAITSRLRAALPLQTDIALVSAGVNDVTSDVQAARWIEQVDALARLLREDAGARLILFAGLPPMQRFTALPRPLRGYLGARAALFNRHLRRWAASRPDCRVLELQWNPDADLIAADGFHPSAVAYAQWAELAAAQIREYLETASGNPVASTAG